MATGKARHGSRNRKLTGHISSTHRKERERVMERGDQDVTWGCKLPKPQ